MGITCKTTGKMRSMLKKVDDAILKEKEEKVKREKREKQKNKQ